ncbi:MAG: hypothetical protein GFH27_549413n23 [Chloroflexi bacterium AL-W]|nr:hypothetical protein [Chloroflexi bacterium AL-N1]NOK71421.1 hypothetical protein [Chloroflexi bacterium AL-N10]NOK78824.1 hypothetical protein [Chloroflexi bacterium AL-N5]NOK86242.1 hypothetical protein [Chloroflexi bacterium AL-W]NOK93146.1 hypothetical protein [Chloroflexi bacterium AL-N15]
MSLRRRLTISYVSFFAIALIILDLGLYMIVRQVLIENIDNELQRTANLLQDNFEKSNKTVPAYFDGEGWRVELNQPQIPAFRVTRHIVQIYEQNGQAVEETTMLPAAFLANQRELTLVLEGNSVFQTTTTDSFTYRQLLQPLFFGGTVAGVLQIMSDMGVIDQALALFSYALFSGGVVVLMAAALGGAWITREAFKPIEEISYTAENIVRAEDLSRRIPIPESQDELQQLTYTMNDLLGRLENLFNTQQRLLADVSHELRTPLAAMRGNLEVLDRGAARNPEMLAESLDDMRREVNRLIRMVNDLLLLARSEAGLQLRREPIELDTLVLEIHRELRPLASGIHLRLGNEDQITIVGDRDRIKQALLNLGINALQHTPQGGDVTLNLSQADGYAQLSVADTGVGIANEDLPHIFNRFYRTDPSRVRRAGGSGLGLAIVKWITEAHGGRVVVESTPNVGSTFTLLLPLDPSLHLSQGLQFVHAKPQLTE